MERKKRSRLFFEMEKNKKEVHGSALEEIDTLEIDPCSATLISKL